jgi:spore coat protein U-like protein
MKKRVRVCCLAIAVFCSVWCCAHLSYAVCNVSTTPVTFGSYDVFSPAPLDASGAISVQCDEVPPARVNVAVGPSPYSGGFDPRMMSHSTRPDLLHYNLYTDRNRTAIWGDGSGNTFTRTRVVTRHRPRVFTVYSRIPPLQDVSAGNYTDTLTVTITW